ncbi:MAG TPA: SCP2 sterol-binding domain-containing protein [Usitatibacter sp.]
MSQALRETLDGLKARFRSGCVDKKTTYYLSLGDRDDEKWTVTLTDTTCDLTAGKTGTADCVLKTSADLFMKMLAGTHKAGPMDFVTGKIKTNDLDLLLRLQKAFGF